MTTTTAKLHTRFDRLSQGLLVGTFLAFPVALALGNVLAALGVVTILLSGHLQSRWRRLVQLPSAWAMLLLLLLIVVGSIYTSAPGSTVLVHLFKYIKLLVGMFFILVLFDATTRRYCLYAFMAAMGFILASVYAGIFVALPWSVTQQPGWGVDHTVVGDYITQSVMMTFFVLTCLAFAWKFKSSGARAGWIILALMGSVSITHLSGGRTGVFLLGSCLLVSGVATARGKKKIWVLGAIFALAGMVTASSPLLMNKVRLGWQEVQTHESNKHNSLGHRLYNYQSVVTLIEKHPLAGTGTGSFDKEACRLNTNPADCQEFGWHPHNQYLFFLVENGALGGLLFVALIASLFYAARQRSTPDKFLMMGFATALAADSLVNSPLFSARESHFFIFMMALLIAGPVIEKHIEPPTSTP